MLLTAPLLALSPLLAAAIPAYRDITFQEDRQRPQPVLPSTGGNGEDIDLDLNSLRLVSFGADEPARWMTELEKIQAKAAGERFMDITDHPDLGLTTFFQTAAIKYEYAKPGKHAKKIHEAFKSFDLNEMEGFLRHFSSYRTRYYKSQTGKESQQWLKQQLEEITEVRDDVTVSEFAHTWGQNSLIVRFEPKEKSMKDEAAVVIGAHQDSAHQWPFLPAPGADDDGSGTTSTLTAIKGLIAANYTPVTPVEFMYFSAEEGGLLGSQAVAQDYERSNRKVKAMYQVDMTAWVKKGTKEVVGVIEDFVDPDLTDWMETLIHKYLAIPPARTKCGYACSDHASFRKAGYPSSFIIESKFEDSNQNIHTQQDTIDHPEFSFEHMREFSKLALAFAVELGGWAE